MTRAVLGFAALSLLSGALDAPDLFSRGGIAATLRFAAPILLAGLGALWAERSGVINIGLEGMMIAGTWFGAWAAIEWGIGPGLVAGIGAGVAFGLIHALLSVTFGVDQAISGLSLNLLAAGLTRFLSSVAFATVPGGSITTSPPVPDLPAVSLAWIDPLLGPVERAGVPILSDAAAVVLGLFTDVSVLTIAVVALVPITWWVLWRTRVGLRIRAVGEAPEAADSLGVRPWRYRFVALGVSGGLAGLGGVYLVTVASSLYREGQTAGRGFIGLATVIFGNWNPWSVTLGSLVFGFTDALRTRQELTVGALLVGLALLLGLVAARRARSRDWRGVALFGVPAAAMLGWFLVVRVVPSELVSFAPHLATLLVLAFARQRLRPPAALGVPFRRAGEP
ncbi:MAG TPA: ABC transporter permease [Candidatus Sulfomarinibacteraceae bacterium]|nr:ABC transporter permease [Candidatus Sulfomarinibacteraceae bacterium]